MKIETKFDIGDVVYRPRTWQGSKRASALPWDEWVKRSAKVLGDNPSVFPGAEAYVSEEEARGYADDRIASLVGHDLAADGLDMTGATLLFNGRPIGTVTSGTLSHEEGQAVTSDDDEATS